MLFISFIIITVLIGWWLATVELSSGFSGLMATEVVRKRYLGVIIILAIIIGGCFLSNSFVEAIVEKSYLTASGSAIIIVVAASLAVLMNYKLSRFTSIAYAVMGALLAWNLFNGERFDYWLVIKYIMIWLAIPILSALLTSLLCKTYRFFIHRSNIHLLLLIPYLRFSLLVVAIVFALFIGINNGSLLVLLNKTIAGGFDFSWNGFNIGEENIFFIFSVLLIAFLTWNKTSAKMAEMAEGKFDVNIDFVLIVLTAGTIVLAFFSIPTLVNVFSLPVTPLSIAGIILGGFSGINLVRGSNGTNYTEEFRMLLSNITTPFSAFILSYFIFSIINTNTFLPKEIETVENTRNIINLTPLITTVIVLLFFTFLIIYIRNQRKVRMQAEIISLENQKRLFENQKAMADLEVKTVVAENENLNSKLELRRRELINIALSITEQKKYQEKLYNEIKSLKEKNDLGELKKGIDGIEKQLLQKMNYSQELESFYAQVESVHKDFNIRLTEKFPKLTEQDRRLATLLRLGFSSKHIAVLMNIAPKSVEISRYRLRSKMGLNRNDNLIQFIKLI